MNTICGDFISVESEPATASLLADGHGEDERQVRKFLPSVSAELVLRDVYEALLADTGPGANFSLVGIFSFSFGGLFIFP